MGVSPLLLPSVDHFYASKSFQALEKRSGFFSSGFEPFNGTEPFLSDNAVLHSQRVDYVSVFFFPSTTHTHTIITWHRHSVRSSCRGPVAVRFETRLAAETAMYNAIIVPPGGLGDVSNRFDVLLPTCLNICLNLRCSCRIFRTICTDTVHRNELWTNGQADIARRVVNIFIIN